MWFRAFVLFSALALWPASAFAAMAGGLKGVVHDPQHRPVAGAVVTLKAQRSDWEQTAITDAAGEFQFVAVPVGDYIVSVSSTGFEAAPQLATIVSGPSPEMHFQLQIATVRASTTVTADSESARPMTPTPTTLVTRDDVAGTPGADLTNSLKIITSFVPGAYLAHDQLHVRGGHQVSWLIDGVPVPNTNIASNVGPQVDPKDIDYMEIQRGSYDAAYGDRTYGVFNIVPRTGFERNKEAEVVATLGSYWQTNDQISFGDHTSRLAYYTSLTFNHSDLGLETPVAEVTHDGQSGLGGFGSVIFNPDSHNQLRLVTSVRHDRYQIPIGPDEIAAVMDDNERETDAVVNVSWIRTFSPTTLLTVSPFYHYNAADYLGGSADFPISTTVLRSSQYAGAQVTLNADRGRHQMQAGFYGYYQHDNQVVGLGFNDGSAPGFTDGETPSGTLAAVFVQDAIAVAPWLTLTAGVRQTHFSGGLTEDVTSPRVGFALRVPRGGWAVRGFYGRFYQAPPLITGTGPLEAFVTAQNLGFIPLHGERDAEYQVGVTVPIHGWMVDGDRFQTSATNYFDHNNVGNSNVFFPVTIDGALIQGWELTVRSPRSWKHAQVHLAYSHQIASGIGGISGGLTDFSPPPEGSFPLDHDQRNTLSVGADAHWARGWFGGATVSYGSGFPSDTGWLPAHTTIDLSCGKQFSKNVSVSGSVLNLTDERVLIDNSLTFGGTHYNYPREIYVQFRYRFRY
jgi:outer membrane receptor protein involved in Fe transport